MRSCGQEFQGRYCYGCGGVGYALSVKSNQTKLESPEPGVQLTVSRPRDTVPMILVTEIGQGM